MAGFLLLAQGAAAQKTLSLNQNMISLILGVYRANSTETAISLKSQKIIQYSRGSIIVSDRPQLEAIACECYTKIKSSDQTLDLLKITDFLINKNQA
ncbi:MAG: helix-turn-helix domain-containing protein [Cyanobacteria bacterium J06600_6]